MSVGLRHDCAASSAPQVAAGFRQRKAISEWDVASPMNERHSRARHFATHIARALSDLRIEFAHHERYTDAMSLARSRLGSTSFARKIVAALAIVVSSAGAAACSKHLPLAAPAAPLSHPTRLCAVGEAPPACRSAHQVEQLLGGELTILGMTDPPSGSQGAKLLTLRGMSGGRAVVFRAKWRPQSSDDLVNESRKELAACAVQKLFLDDAESVAPPTAPYCFALREYHAFVPTEQATFAGTDCVFGFMSYWLEDILSLGAARERGLVTGDGILDRARFERDLVYRGSLAKANLLTYVINHGDAHDDQFLLQSTAHGFRAFVVDNSISFQSIKNPMLLFREDWSQIQVPHLPKASVERLAKLTEDDYNGLGSVAQLQRRGGELVAVHSADAHAKSDGSAMTWNGEQLRVGLTANEIELVKSRIQQLLTRPDLAQLTAEH